MVVQVPYRVFLVLNPTLTLNPENNDFVQGAEEEGDRSVGERRILRLLHRLHYTEVFRHTQIIEQITAAQPDIAAAFLGTASVSLEPRLETRWVAGMTVVGKIIQEAARARSPLLLR